MRRPAPRLNRTARRAVPTLDPLGSPSAESPCARHRGLGECPPSYYPPTCCYIGTIRTKTLWFSWPFSDCIGEENVSHRGTEFTARRSRNPRALNHGFTPMDTDGKVRFPDPTGNGSEFLFRRRVQQRLLRASASLRENRLFLLSFSIPTSPSRSPAEAQGCGELSGFSMETGRFPPSVFNGVEKSAAQRGKRWQVIFRFPRPFPSGIRKSEGRAVSPRPSGFEYGCTGRRSSRESGGSTF